MGPMSGDTTHLLLLYLLTEIVACLSPGPAVLTVASQALAGSRAGAIGAICGINAGNLVWYALAGAGLSAVEAAFPFLFTGLRWVGIAYLLWLGISHWRHAGAQQRWEAAQRKTGFRRGLISAMAVQLSNPKALLFFTVLLPPFINSRQPILLQIVVLAVIGVVVEALVLAGYAAMAWRLGRMARGHGAIRRIDQASGALLIAAATGLAANSLHRA